jgi:hypothetical protein
VFDDEVPALRTYRCWPSQSESMYMLGRSSMSTPVSVQVFAPLLKRKMWKSRLPAS